MSDPYIPRVNDYVKWKEGFEGWVYFYCPDYITIELYVKKKPDDLVKIHKMTHVCILCYSYQWDELTFIKRRKSVYDQVSGDVSGESESTEGSVLQD